MSVIDRAKMNFDKFLPDQNNKRMFPGFVVFCVVLIGVLLGFIASYFKFKFLFIISITMTLIGILCGFILIAYGWAIAIGKFIRLLLGKYE
ncbi:hypothetical protein NBRC116493_02430 [Aurantivibrio infirmus]